jgi:hypothetical protein
MVTNDDDINQLFREGLCDIPNGSIRLKRLSGIGILESKKVGIQSNFQTSWRRLLLRLFFSITHISVADVTCYFLQQKDDNFKRQFSCLP